MEEKKYSEKLKHPKWQRKRLEIMNRDNFTCQKCGDTETTLHVHHLEYNDFDEPWKISNKKLITLCEDCHGEVEGLKEYEPEFETIHIYKSKGWTNNQTLIFVAFYSRRDGVSYCRMTIRKDNEIKNRYNFSNLTDLYQITKTFDYALDLQPLPPKRGSKEWYLSELKRLGIKSTKIKPNTSLKKLKEVYKLKSLKDG